MEIIKNELNNIVNNLEYGVNTVLDVKPYMPAVENNDENLIQTNNCLGIFGNCIIKCRTSNNKNCRIECLKKYRDCKGGDELQVIDII